MSNNKHPGGRKANRGDDMRSVIAAIDRHVPMFLTLNRAYLEAGIWSSDYGEVSEPLQRQELQTGRCSAHTSAVPQYLTGKQMQVCVLFVSAFLSRMATGIAGP